MIPRTPRIAAARMLVAGVVFALSGSARADVISDDEAACRGKQAGDACEIGGEAGTCKDSTCSRNDYSEGPPPKIVSKPCMVCERGGARPDGAAAPSEPTPADAEPSDAKADGEPSDAPPADAASSDAKAVEAKDALAHAPPDPAPSQPADAAAPKKAAGCMGRVDVSPLSFGSVALGLVLLLALGRGRRRP